MATDGTATTRTTPISGSTTPHRQKRMGPAPFASFEDLSDEVRSRLESPEEKAGCVVRLPGIREDITPSSPNMSQAPVYTGISLVGQIKTPLNPSTSFADSIPNPVPSASKLQTPHAPRIDISRASSSSHHDSKDSSPDRDIIEGKYEGTRDQGTTKLGVGFREDGTLDLRSSTEELDFQDKEQEKRKNRSRPQSPACLQDESYQNHSRKDSQCSEIGLLSISGRTSRLSSIGSVGSAQSRISNASHLSALSGATELSRSPSPHKMLLETSFCGTKSPQSMSSVIIDKIGTKIDTDDLEKILLSRKHDPTEALLAEGIHVKKEIRSSSMKQVPDKPARKFEKRGQSVKSEITIKIDTPSVQNDDGSSTPRPTKKIVSESGIEYIYIPLKGPLPLDLEENTSTTTTKQTTSRSSRTTGSKPRSKPSSAPPKLKEQSGTVEKRIISQNVKPREITSAPVQRKDEPKYIRIKLKPDHLYDNEDSSNTSPEIKTEKMDFDEIRTDESTTGTYDTGKSLTSTPSLSPKFSRHGVILDSKTPSPSLSRKSSFASIFRSKEAITSPESPTVPGKRKNTITGILKEASESLRERRRSRSRSKSRERDKPPSNVPSSTESINSKDKMKGGILTIFKSPRNGTTPRKSRSSSPEIPKVDVGKKPSGKLTFEKPLEGDSVRIPLHSPEYYDKQRNYNFKDVQTPSQDSQDTVIEVLPAKKEEVTETSSQPENGTKESITEHQSRQSSTSSENIVFSTNIGSSNEIFSTKLPKDKKLTRSENVKVSNGHLPQDTITKTFETVQIEAHKEPESPKIEKTMSTTSLKKMIEEAEISPEPRIERVLSKHFSADDEKNNSSESEKDSEASFVSAPKTDKPKKENEMNELLEPEFKSLVIQDSFEDELPYVPTTLPLERSSAVPIVPIKQRSTFEMKMYPIDRPRSTTPINPSSLEDYCEEMVGHSNPESLAKSIEKLKISLPRSDSSKSPKKPKNTTWFEFAEKGIHTGRKLSGEIETPPPLPPKKIQKEWINFEEVPERRKLPKRIQTIPSRSHIEVADNVLHDNVLYNYVNPDECKCECHEKKDKKESDIPLVQDDDDEVPLLENEPDDEKIPTDRKGLSAAITDRESLISESSVDLSTAEAIQADSSLQTPFKNDLDVSSNRSSIVSQDDVHSPYTDKPNAFFRTS